MALATCLQELLFSSSSSDKDISLLINIENTRSSGSSYRMKHFINILHSSTDVEFRKHFRISKNTTNHLIEKYKQSKFYVKQGTWLRGTPRKLAETEMLLFLWFAANKTCIRDVAQRFDTSFSAAHNIIETVMDFLLEIAPQYIHFPKSAEEKKQLSSAFFKIAGFPSTVGCIDGTSIPVVTPAHKIKSTYVNRHDVPAITLQGICDHRKCFIDVFNGIPGKIHDSRVLRLSHIQKSLPDVCGSNYHIIGDSAYPIREWLLTPYKDYGNLDQDELHFNKTFCATRVLIENSFGMLKSRFRQLLQVHMHSVDKISKFIISCCVLHNLCIINCDELEQHEYVLNCSDTDLTEDLPIYDTEGRLRRLGEMKREFIKLSLRV